MTKKVKFGVIGCGGIAERSMIPAIAESETAEVAVLASSDLKKASALAKRFGGVPVEGYEALIERDDVSAVYVATPIGLHRDWCIAAANSGKHVLCEKTLTTSLADTRSIIAACESNGVALLEGFAYQYHPNHAAVKDVINAGEIGEIIQFQAAFGFPPINSAHRYDPALGGGALLDAGTYPVHAARKIFGAEPIKVSAILQNGAENVDIHGSVLLDFGSTQSATFTFGFNNMYQNRYSVWGTKGLIHLERPFSAPPDFRSKMTIEKQGTTSERQLSPANHFALQLEEFCAGIESPAVWESWKNDSLNQAKCLERIREAAN